MGSCAWGFGKAVGMLATRPVNSRRIDAYIAYHMQAKPCRVRVSSHRIFEQSLRAWFE